MKIYLTASGSSHNFEVRISKPVMFSEVGVYQEICIIANRSDHYDDLRYMIPMHGSQAIYEFEVNPCEMAIHPKGE